LVVFSHFSFVSNSFVIERESAPYTSDAWARCRQDQFSDARDVEQRGNPRPFALAAYLVPALPVQLWHSLLQ
jgi:hypothetical protein